MAVAAASPGVAVGCAAGVALGCGAGVPRGVGVAAGDAVGFGVALGVAVAAGVGEGVGCATNVAIAIGPRDARATGVTSGAARDTVFVVSRCCIAESNAPIPSPATTTPMPSAMVGHMLDDGGGCAERRRRGGSGIDHSISCKCARSPPGAVAPFRE